MFIVRTPVNFSNINQYLIVICLNKLLISASAISTLTTLMQSTYFRNALYNSEGGRCRMELHSQAAYLLACKHTFLAPTVQHDTLCIQSNSSSSFSFWLSLTQWYEALIYFLRRKNYTCHLQHSLVMVAPKHNFSSAHVFFSSPHVFFSSPHHFFSSPHHVSLLRILTSQTTYFCDSFFYVYTNYIDVFHSL